MKSNEIFPGALVALRQPEKHEVFGIVFAVSSEIRDAHDVFWSDIGRTHGSPLEAWLEEDKLRVLSP